MDIKNSLDFRYDRYKAYCNTGNNKYNYAKNGILQKCMPKILFKANPALISFLQLIDLRIVMMLKYIEQLKYFKDLTFYK